jgi:hypothetical protein
VISDNNNQNGNGHVEVSNNTKCHKKIENHTAVIPFRKLSAVKQAMMQQFFF